MIRILLAHLAAIILLFAQERLAFLLIMLPTSDGRIPVHIAQAKYIIFPIVGGLLMGAEYGLLIRERPLVHAVGFLAVWVLVLTTASVCYTAKESDFSVSAVIQNALIQCAATILALLVVVRLRQGDCC